MPPSVWDWDWIWDWAWSGIGAKGGATRNISSYLCMGMLSRDQDSNNRARGGANPDAT
jgi:hypothetical protein